MIVTNLLVAWLNRVLVKDSLMESLDTRLLSLLSELVAIIDVDARLVISVLNSTSEVLD